MGVFYHIQPLDEEIAALVGEMGAAVPRFDGTARNPTPGEVREACAALRGFKTQFNVKPGKHWQAVVEGAAGDEGTIVNVEKFKGAEDRPHEIWFEKGPRRWCSRSSSDWRGSVVHWSSCPTAATRRSR